MTTLTYNVIYTKAGAFVQAGQLENVDHVEINIDVEFEDQDKIQEYINNNTPEGYQFFRSTRSDPDLSILTDQELLSEWHIAATNVSFFNAAEGNWREETEARNKCKNWYTQVVAAAKSRGLTLDTSNYLL